MLQTGRRGMERTDGKPGLGEEGRHRSGRNQDVRIRCHLQPPKNTDENQN